MNDNQLLIIVPASFYSERCYIINILFSEFLGLPFSIKINPDACYYKICLPNDAILEISDCFFYNIKKKNDYANSSVLPKYNIYTKNKYTPENDIPLLFGQKEIITDYNRITCNIDIFASCFFMLSRLEEIVISTRDEHDRFSAKNSFSYHSKCLERPIVDEYLEMLWAMIIHLCPQLQRKEKQGKMYITCDVDQPYDRALGNPKQLVRSIAGDMVKRRSLSLANKRIRNYYASRRGNYNFDPYNTFDWYMTICEKYGHKASFYFIPAHSGGTIDGCYSLEENKIQALIQKIANRGHELGVHGSYNSYQHPAQIVKERQNMINVCIKVGADASVLGNRQHYLRWDSATTPDYLDAAGFGYDTTGSFADMPGFRYGTARDFTMWSWINREPLSIKQRPLVLMECSVLSQKYLGLGYTSQAIDKMLLLKKRAMQYGGNFSLLWHNSHFLSDNDHVFFEEIIK